VSVLKEGSFLSFAPSPLWRFKAKKTTLPIMIPFDANFENKRGRNVFNLFVFGEWNEVLATFQEKLLPHGGEEREAKSAVPWIAVSCLWNCQTQETAL
jgi:hypothetical protein